MESPDSRFIAGNGNNPVQWITASSFAGDLSPCCSRTSRADGFPVVFNQSTSGTFGTEVINDPFCGPTSDR
jgi:hypothetical protein